MVSFCLEILRQIKHCTQQLKFVVDEEVVDKLLLLGGGFGLDHDGEGGTVVLKRKRVKKRK